MPNVFDFDHPPRIDRDDYTADIRQEIGIREDDIFDPATHADCAAQGIEHAIKLVGMLNDPRYKLVISHDAGDEGLQIISSAYRIWQTKRALICDSLRLVLGKFGKWTMRGIRFIHCGIFTSMPI